MNLGEKRFFSRQVGGKYRCQEKEAAAQEKKQHTVPFSAARKASSVKKWQEAEKQVDEEKKAPDEKFSLPVVCGADGRKISGKQGCFPAQSNGEKGDSKISDKIKCHI